MLRGASDSAVTLLEEATKHAQGEKDTAAEARALIANGYVLASRYDIFAASAKLSAAAVLLPEAMDQDVALARGMTARRALRFGEGLDRIEAAGSAYAASGQALRAAVCLIESAWIYLDDYHDPAKALETLEGVHTAAHLDATLLCHLAVLEARCRKHQGEMEAAVEVLIRVEAQIKRSALLLVILVCRAAVGPAAERIRWLGRAQAILSDISTDLSLSDALWVLDGNLISILTDIPATEGLPDDLADQLLGQLTLRHLNDPPTFERVIGHIDLLRIVGRKQEAQALIEKTLSACENTGVIPRNLLRAQDRLGWGVPEAVAARVYLAQATDERTWAMLESEQIEREIGTGRIPSDKRLQPRRRGAGQMWLVAGLSPFRSGDCRI